MRFFRLFSFLLLISILWLVGCHPVHKLSTDTPVDSEIKYRLIYIIHGDANYLYHNKDGLGLRADKQKMAEAKKIAKHAKKGEVFIFYQKPERKILWLFPRKDRLFLHYRNGRQINRKKYSPVASRETFIAESRLYSSSRSKQKLREIFLYFGHEIPEHSRPYHNSRPEAAFNTYIFAEGLKQFLTDDQRFDLTVLSTCNNGTPQAAYRMLGVSRYLLASPQNLHLSHIDTHPLLKLEEDSDKPAYDLAVNLAQDTYSRLSKFLETSVTLSVYDLQSDDFFSLAKLYSDYQAGSTDQFIDQENIDCARLPFWDGEFEIEGPNVFYKPAAFGRNANQQTHSGWGCRP